ncbi:MAG: toprim domain-containing protein, partial [Thermoleophilia bacterium]|nr:toprim domain-containing protein [Thermoleophilia bacterium]
TEGGKDFFRGRPMVPIIDRPQRVIGFGARKLHEEQFGGKYMNSADGPLFHKKQTVFLAPGIADAAKQAGQVVVVEGYMDVIAMWQAGFRNTCAVMGTALTEEQVVELKRIAPRALFAFDPDAAGQIATLRALDQARAHDLDVRVVLLPDGEDPADVLHGEQGRARMEELLNNGVSLLHFRTSSLLGSGDLGDTGERDRIYNEAVELYRTVPDGPEKREQVLRFGNALQLDSGGMESMYAATGAATPMRLSRRDGREPHWREQRAVQDRVSTGPQSTALNREKRLLALALRRAEMGPIDLAAVLPPESSFAVDLHRRARNMMVEQGIDALAPARVRDDAPLFQLVSELAAPQFASGFVDQSTNKGAEPAIDDSLVELARLVEVQGLDRQLGELRARATDPAADDDALLIEQTQLRRRIRELNPRLVEAPDER